MKARSHNQAETAVTAPTRRGGVRRGAAWLGAAWLGAAALGLAGLAGPGQAQEAPAPRQEAPARSAQAGGQAAATSACLDRTVDAIQRRYESIRDFSARFEQTTQAAHLGATESAPTRSSGRVVVAKPARMRWEYRLPEPSLVVSDGDTLWIYDPAFREAQRLPVGDGFLSGAAIQFLLGEGDMRKSFRIAVVDCTSEEVELELVPREDASYEKLRVVADAETGQLTRTQVHDLLGNVTRVTFAEVLVNQEPPAETFRFTPPEGVTVIDLQRPQAQASP